MDKEQIIMKMKENKGKTTFIVILLLLLLYSMTSDSSKSASADEKDMPYGYRTMNDLGSEPRVKEDNAAIKPPAYSALERKVKACIGFDMSNPSGKLYATADVKDKLELSIRKPATYASKVVIRNIRPNSAILGSAEGYIWIEVLRPFGEGRGDSFSVGASSTTNGTNDFWTTIFYDRLTAKYDGEKQLEIPMKERHQWASIPYDGQVIGEITSDSFIKISYVNADGKVEKNVTTKQKAIAFRVETGDGLMSGLVDFYR